MANMRLTLPFPIDFDPKRYQVVYDDHSQEFVTTDRLTKEVFNVTAHAMAVLVDDEYRRAVFATHDHVKQTVH